MGSLPHVASKLAAGEPVMIVAFGSSSTQGHGSTSPTSPIPTGSPRSCGGNIRPPTSPCSTRGKGGEDAPEMMKRLQTAVLDRHPDLVIWQVGTNAVLRNLDPAETVKLVEEGIARIQAAGADLVLVDPQYSPAVNARAESASKMVNLLGKVAELRHVGIFPRFEVMRDWHEKQSIPIDKFVIADGLHMSDWGYACFAQLLGDDIITVGRPDQARRQRAGERADVPADVGVPPWRASCPAKRSIDRPSGLKLAPRCRQLAAHLRLSIRCARSRRCHRFE